METKVAVVCTIGGILGLLSAALGFAAEATKVKGSQIVVDIRHHVCVHPDSPASTLGYVSVLTLVVALVMIHVVGGCFCCYRSCEQRPSNSPLCQCNQALVCFIFSWVIFVPAFLLMLGAAILSAKTNLDKLHRGDHSYSKSSYYYYCYYVKPGVFATAACLSFISVALGITYSLNMDVGIMHGPSTTHIPQGSGIAMGQPQVPPNLHPSGFAYEQT